MSSKSPQTWATVAAAGPVVDDGAVLLLAMWPVVGGGETFKRIQPSRWSVRKVE